MNNPNTDMNNPNADMINPKRRFQKSLIVLLFCLSCLFLVTQSIWGTSEFPEPAGYVNDYAGILTSRQYQILNDLIEDLQTKTSAEVAVVTLKSVEPYEVNLYAVKLFEQWGIGAKGKDNGVLILLALKERQVRLEVGYSLEGTLPDGLAGEIIRRHMTPHFKQGNYGQGIMDGTIATVYHIAREYGVEITGLPKTVGPRQHRSVSSPLSSLLGIFFVLMLLAGLLVFKPGLLSFLLFGPMSGGYWGSSGRGGFGGGFGGFGGFGGGSSGGGGATGSW